MTALHEAVRNMPFLVFWFLVLLTFFGTFSGEFERDGYPVKLRFVDTIFAWLIAFPAFIILLLAYWWV